ncbi:hypothetical protein J1N35_004707 [Gossypium stocksii]|uniref:RNase H type-1 domain-containing protein n=1 Tax=Gossypium stocksii TaxID=47602 RepID=A0A9D4AGC9_9ROSI|nr:hypothetical protein J1N35_004707 [Gossypium stocksii]
MIKRVNVSSTEVVNVIANYEIVQGLYHSLGRLGPDHLRIILRSMKEDLIEHAFGGTYLTSLEESQPMHLSRKFLEFKKDNQNSGNVVAGGVVRDENGDWIFGYNRCLGKCLIFYAELWGILEGLKLIQRRGHDIVTIQSDNLEVVQAIQGSVSSTLNSALIRRIQSIPSQEKQWSSRYILREQNQVVDCLAKQALLEKDDLQIFDLPPIMVQAFLEMDKTRSFLPFQNILL